MSSKRNSCEQGLITKKCIATHTNYFYMALYSKRNIFNNSRKLFQAENIIVKLKAGLLLNASLHIHPLIFITEVFCLSGSPSVASTTSP